MWCVAVYVLGGGGGTPLPVGPLLGSDFYQGPAQPDEQPPVAALEADEQGLAPLPQVTARRRCRTQMEGSLQRALFTRRVPAPSQRKGAESWRWLREGWAATAGGKLSAGTGIMCLQ